MDKRILGYVNWAILVIVTIAAIWIVWGSFGNNGYGDADVGIEGGVDIPCIDVSGRDEFSYEACYDAYHETIFLKISRGKQGYEVEDISVSFVDLSSKVFDLDEVPIAGEDRAYKIPADKNPASLDVLMRIRGTGEKACDKEDVYVDYCPAGTGGDVGGSISPIEGVFIDDFIEVEDAPDFDSDAVVMDLADKEAIWESVCKSIWECGEWEACENEVSHRSCVDMNDCLVPTDSPITAVKCDGSCIENWECEWGSCIGGVSVPSCRDLNGCGTSYDLPEELPCEEEGNCVPQVSCGEWTNCEVDYDFVDLIGVEGVAEIEGVKTRVCVDKRGCIATQKEETVCSVSVDVYTERFERCGETHVGVYNVLDDSTLAILKEGEGNSYLNIYFDDVDGVYCDYCYDGKKDGDEEAIDCGGSCKACEVKVLEDRHWWDFLF